MKNYILPSKELWEEICARPVINNRELSSKVIEIMDKVKQKGDKALVDYVKEFDRCVLDDLKVSSKEIEEAEKQITRKLKEAILIAKGNIEKFHRSQIEMKSTVETMEGVTCWRKPVAIEKVGLYIPGGSAPLFSTVLMLAIPAIIAGCNEIVMMTPPMGNSKIHPAILYTAKIVGITNIFKVGGAQAISALTFGTETVPAVSKIFGPGNQYVTKAKELSQMSGVAIDMPAGPSEVLVIADESCYPNFVASDLLSQAEHGPDSQVILLTTSKEVLKRVQNEVSIQLNNLPRKEIAQSALSNSRLVLCENIEECIDLSNHYAPEHLILASDKAMQWADKIINAGSVFVGNYSCESAGDYASGTNHTLPTNGYAKNYSGVSVDSFVRKITFQEITKEGMKAIGPSIEELATAENLIGHKNAISIRLKELDNV